jgi:phosphoglucomutase
MMPTMAASTGAAFFPMASLAARPSGTEDLYKLYAESFRDERHLQAIVDEARQIVAAALAASA